MDRFRLARTDIFSKRSPQAVDNSVRRERERIHADAPHAGLDTGINAGNLVRRTPMPGRAGGLVLAVCGCPHAPVPAKTQPSPTLYTHTFKEFPTVANIKSQIKRIRTNEKRRIRNQAVKSELKTLVRRTREAIEAGDKEAALEALRIASRKLDKAVSKGVIHRNQAANRKSKLAKRVQSL